MNIRNKTMFFKPLGILRMLPILMALLFLDVAVAQTDTDGDTVEDAMDSDDDNDGILDVVEGCETTDIDGTIGLGNPVPDNVTYSLPGTDITYALNNPDNMDIFGYDALGNGHSIQIEADAGDAGSMSVSYSTPISGVQFKLSDFDHQTQYTIEIYDENNVLYDLSTEGVVALGSTITQTGNYFEASVGDIDGDDPADDALGSILFYFTGSVSRIVFNFSHPVNSSTRFTQPLYCIQDTDNDGIPDFHDLDSDGDGIPDNVEAQTTIGYVAPSGTVDANGIDTAYPTGITPIDIDGAEGPDYLDLDSDNEGGNDTAEANITLTGNDTDNDGLDDATDATPDYSDAGGTIDNPLSGSIILQDVDNDATTSGDVDFRDATDDRLDSDNDGVPDDIDLDDDNDGILDSEECQNTSPMQFQGLSTAVQSYTVLTTTITQNSPSGSIVGAHTDNNGNLAFSSSNTSVDISTSNPSSFIISPATNGDVDFDGIDRWTLVSAGANFIVRDPLNNINIVSNTIGSISFMANNGNPQDWSIEVYDIADLTITMNRGNGRSDVNVSVIIQCRDNDNDGLPNNLDLDTDNDGILDVVEAGHGQPYSNGAVNGPVGTDGIPDSVQSDPNGGTINYVVAESPADSDSIFDFLDLDSDGDGIPDNVEAQSTLGYLPPNADDAATYAANLGRNSAYLGGLNPDNTDTVDLPDYLDTNSDNEGAPDGAEAGLTPANTDIDNDGLDDATDADTSGYADPGGTIDNPLTGSVILPDEDTDARLGGDIDFRDTTDNRLDSDNDGTYDGGDLDDDNDGIPDEIENATCYGGGGSGVMFSEDFGAGARTTTPYTNYTYEPNDWMNDGGSINDGEYAILSDIQNSASWAAGLWVDQPDHTGNPDGRMALFNSTNSPAEEFYNRGNIAMVPNVLMEFSFWVKNIDLATSNNSRTLPNITVYVRDNAGTVTLETFSTGNVAKDEQWHKYNFTFDPGSNTEISFVMVNNASGGLGNDLVLDDFNIAILCDVDGDGVTNSLDIDSDNDGILDIVEGGALEEGATDADSNGKIDGVEGDFGNNGLFNALESDDTLSATLTYSVGESADDADAIPNFLDLDSDGDGIPDNVEAQTTLGYISQNNDDAAYYESSEGLNSAYTGGLVPVNTDTTDNPDYLDVDSDNEGGDDAAEAGLVLTGNDLDGDGLDDVTDISIDYSVPEGIIDSPVSGGIRLPDTDEDALMGGDVDFRDATDDRLDTDGDGIVDVVDLDDDNDGIPDNEECSLSPLRTGPIAASDLSFDIEGTGGTESGILNSISVNGVGNLLDYFVKPTAYTSSFTSNDPNDIHEQYHAMRLSDITSPSWNTDIRLAFQSQDLNHYQATDNTIVPSDNWTLTYDPVQVTTEGFLVLMERAGNNPYSLNVFDPSGNLINGTPYIVELTAYRDTPVDTSNGQNIKLAIIPMTDLAPVGTLVGSIQFFPHNTTGNGPDGKAFITTDGDICNDTDGDGIINSLDLDSDNDGIFDVVESAVLNETGANDSDNDGRLDGNPSDFGNNGLLNAIENDDSLAANIQYTLAESDDDLDTIPNFMDLDSDGDGLPDNVEAQTTTGYTIPNGTVDANGVDTAYPLGLTPTNTDTTDTPDYLDLNSDNEGANDTSEAGIALAGEDSDTDGLDDGMDTNLIGYSDPGGTVDNPLTDPLRLLDTDNDASTGGDVDFRDAIDDRPDNDNDGIVDALDFDDDNDGILDTDEGCGNRIINGSFEQQNFTDAAQFPNGFTGPQGTFIGTTYNTNTLASWDYTQNVDGWVEGGTFGTTIFADAYHGNQYVDVIGANNVTGGISNILSQRAELVPGNTYELSFFWGEDIGHVAGDPMVLEFELADAGGGIILNETLTSIAQGPVNGVTGARNWFYITRTFTATTAEMTVRFTTQPPARNDTVGISLDFVSIVATDQASCADTDNDGIPDAFDLDSDNDGIYDAVEAGHAASHTNGVLDGSVGTDGIPDSVQDNPDRETVNYIPFDSDGDATLDAQELDSDDDGCFDVVEAGFADDHGDGQLGDAPIAVDAEGRVTSASDGYTAPLDSDANGTFDYREFIAIPVIDMQPVDVAVCSGTPVIFSVAATDADSYQWQSFDGTAWIDLTDGANYGGTATDSLQLATTLVGDNATRFRALVSRTGFACGNLISDEALLTVQQTPDVIIGDAEETEGGIIRFPITLSSIGCLAEDVTMTFTFTDGSADATDYTGTDVQLTIPAGSLEGEVAVQTTQDEIDESDETFTISIASIDAGTVGDFSDTATGTILDDDITELDSDDDGILDSFEDLNEDGDNDPATNPTNSDGDLYPDYLDIDSDDDGIPDNVEAQTTAGYIPPSLQDVNANGLDDAYEMGVRLGLIPVNTDGEDFPDYLDADSDNDNVPDNIEGHDADRDGVADVSFIGSDKDDDGLDDGYEGAVQIDIDVNDEIDDPFGDLPNTDNDGDLDYRDTDDDNDDIPTRNEDGNADRNYANDDIDRDGTPDYLEPNYPDVEVFNVVTPNDDGVHDYLMIDGLDIRPNNTIQIYNRWGVLVYETESYDSNGNRFNGTSQARATFGKGETLPVGTYFYILNYENLEGGFNTLSGYLYLN